MALVPDQKFSTFDDGGDLEVGDIIVGLRNGLNTRFDYTGELPVGVIVPIANGGTGANNAADARTNLGLGTIATQDANAVAITGGTAALASGSVAAAPVAGIDIANKTYVDGLVPSAIPSPGSDGTIIRSDTGAWVTSTATFANTYGASELLYSNTANTVEGLATANSAMLYTNSSGVPAWSASLADGELMVGTSGGSPSPTTLTPGTGISIANAAGSITVSATGGGFGIATIAGTSQSAVVNTMYIALNSSQTTVTLPGTCSVGDSVILVGSTANTGGWVLTAAAGDTIMYNGTATSGGGTITCSALAGQTIEVVCDVADTSWVVVDTVNTLLTTA